MTQKTVADLEQEASIRREYLVTPEPKYGIGWVEATIERFEIDEERNDLDIVVRLPWGEEHHYGCDLDNVWDSQLSKWCQWTGVEDDDFPAMQYETVWMRVRKLSVTDGEISSATQTAFSDVPPHATLRARIASWSTLDKAAAIYFAMAIAFGICLLLL